MNQVEMGGQLDHIRLKEIIVFGYFGTTEAEQLMGQRLMIDLDLELDLTTAAGSDDLADTVSYPDVYKLVQNIAGEYRCSLLEYLAGRLMDAIMASFPTIERVTIQVRKINLPFPTTCREMEIVMTRTRGD